MDSLFELSIIIPFYKGHDYIYNCVNSISIPSNIKCKILIIDNDSSGTTISIDKFSANSDIIEIVKTRPNLGFGLAINYGFSLIKDNSEYVIFLNQDCLLDSNLISALLDKLRTSKKNCMYSPFLINYEDDSTHSSLIGLNNEIDNLKAEAEEIELEYIPAVCLAAHAALIKDIGGFDPVFFHYGEDNDFFLRNRNKIRLFLLTNLRIKHLGSLKKNFNTETEQNFLLGKLRYKLRYEDGNRYWKTLYHYTKSIYKNSRSLVIGLQFINSGYRLTKDNRLNDLDEASVKNRIEKSLKEAL